MSRTTCRVDVYTNGKRTDYMYFSYIEHGIAFLIDFLNNFNAREQIYNGVWKKVYDVHVNKKLDKTYEINLGFIKLQLTTRGSKEIDKRQFEQLLKDIDNETF